MFANLMPSLLKGSRIVQSFVVKNSSTILTTLGVCTLSAAVVSTYKAAVKVHNEVEKAKKELEDKRTSQDEETLKQIKRAATIKVLKIMVVPILFALMCAGCIIGNNYIHLKKQATLAAAYALSEQTLRDYEESLEPIVGKKKAEAVREEVAHKDVERRGTKDESQVINTGKGNILFYDQKTGHYFRSTHDAVRLAFSEANNEMNNYKCMKDEYPLDNIYRKLGLPAGTDVGLAYGWQSGESIGVNLNQTGTSDWNEPYVYINYHVHLLDGDTTL